MTTEMRRPYKKPEIHETETEPVTELHTRALEVADSLAEMLENGDVDDCPICGGSGGDHESDFGDGKGGCPLLEYLEVRGGGAEDEGEEETDE